MSWMKNVLRHKWVIALGLIVLIVGAWYWYRRTATVATQKTYVVKRGNLRELLTLSGKIDAHEKVSLHFQTGGRVAWVGPKEGDYLKKYQGIAALDSRQLQKTLEKYLNTYSKQRSTFDQSRDDNDQLTIALSQEVRDRAQRTITSGQSDLNNAVLDVELQNIAKEYSYLYSPIEGIVTHMDITQPGVNAAVTDTFEIVNPESLYFSVAADQTEVIKLTKGKTATILFDSYPDIKVPGVIQAIAYSPKENETGTVYEVKMAFTPNPAMSNRLGMTGDAEFVIQEIARVLIVPSSYILEENGKKYVRVKQGSTFTNSQIRTGAEFDGEVEVRSGLKEGELIYEIPS